MALNSRIVNLIWGYLVNITVSTARDCISSSSCIRCLEPALAHCPLCLACQADLPFLDLDYQCSFCGVTIAQRDMELCNDCLDERPPYDQLRSAFDYRGLIAEYLKRFKYDQDLLYGQVVMHLFWNIWGDQLRNLPPMTLIPVPSHQERLKIRGFNQAYHIAQFLARKLNWPLDANCLKRIKFTQFQHSLNKSDRRRNLREAFIVKNNAPKHAVIIDDIVTTGATVTACTEALRAAGSEIIEVWCMARTSKNM